MKDKDLLSLGITFLIIVLIISILYPEPFNFIHERYNQNLEEPETQETYIPSYTRNDIQYWNNDNQRDIQDELGDYNFYNVNGVSMSPGLTAGDTIICDTTITDYELGQIIVFIDHENSTVAHRIKAIYPDFILTRGDNNQYDDAKITEDNILCVVVGVLY